MVHLSPIHLGKHINRNFQHPKHLRVLNESLLDVAHGKIEGLVVSMPPRHGKSETISKYFPAWYLGRFPDKRVLFASYESTIASSWGRKVRDILQSEANPFTRVKIRKDSHASDHWNIAQFDGGMDCAGIGGSFTGRGANLFIIDDPISNSEQALSKTWRNKVWELFISTVETRAEPGCGFVIVQTRWHQDDLAGRVLRQIDDGTRKNWKVLKFSALAEKDDPLGREPGQALWEGRYSKEYFDNLKKRLDGDEARIGPYWWDALYQQNPVPREGGTFKRSWFKYFTFDDNNYNLLQDGKLLKAFPKTSCWKFLTVDLAVSEKATADYFALGVWVVTPEMDLLLFDVVRDRIAGPDQAPLIVNMSHRHLPMFITVEAVAYQLSLIQDLQRKGMPVKEGKAEKDKVSRSLLAAARMAAGKVYFRKNAPWLTDYETELAQFPKGRNDDMVDITSMAAIEMSACVMPSVS